MALSIIDISSGVLGDVNVVEVTVFTFEGDLLVIIHELLFLLVKKEDSRFPLGLLKIDS